MPTLPRSRPADEGVTAAGVLDFLDAVETSQIELHSLMVLRHGRVVAEGWWSPYAAHLPHLLYSLSKSFTSLATGLAVADGLVAVTDEISQHLGEFTPDDLDDRLRAITVDHALRMATGHVDDLAAPVIAWCERHGDPEWLHALFTMPPERAPGSVFAYNQLATYAVARVVQERTGKGLLDYLTPRLLEPLGITEASWLTDDAGHEWGFSGLHLTTESIASFGQLCLQGGEWEGRQLASADWIATATSALTPNDAAHRGRPDDFPAPDWSMGYGYQFWRSRHGYRGDGAYGQFCLVLPEQDAVIITTAATDEMQALLDLVWMHLLPAFAPQGVAAPAVGDGAPGDADAALAERLRALAIRPPANDASGQPSSLPTGLFTRRGGEGAPSLTAVELGGDDRGVTLGLTIEGRRHPLPVGLGEWLEGEWPAEPPVPFVSAGGWSGGRFVAALRMIQTPHLLRLILEPATATFTADWREMPLHGADPAAHGG